MPKYHKCDLDFLAHSKSLQSLGIGNFKTGFSFGADPNPKLQIASFRGDQSR